MLFRERSLNILSFIFKSKQYNLGGRICNYSEFYKHFFIYLGSHTVKTSVFPEHTMVCSPNTPFVLKITHNKVCFWGV